jgi:hypothetical protein
MNAQSAMTSYGAGDCGCGGHRTSVGKYGGSGGLQPATRGCGCGGSCGGSCGCGAGSGAVGASAFVRPRFFGGMLLTEDDLQAIDDYTVAKRRLTNRQMFGSGVVCGLEVDCDPCKPGWLTVNPGYALDCCGNDIVVGCPEKLDAFALLSELRKREGIDCGEPCDTDSDRTYLLVVSFHEQLTDPVAPYVHDDCAVGDCDFSRVREGYRFDLVCEVQEPDPSLFDRLAECAERADRRGVEADRLVQLAQLATTQAAATAADASGEAPALELPVVADYDAARAEGVKAAAALLGRSTAVLAAAAAHDAKLGPSIGLTSTRRKAISEHTRNLAEELLGSDEVTALPEVERRRVTVILNAAKDQQNLAQLSVGQRIWLSEGYEPAEAARTFVEEAQAVRETIVRKLEQAGRGNCRERDMVERLSVYQFDANSIDTVRRLAQAYWSVVAGCLCDLANPPCPLCTETRVPLAAVRIENCEVVDVCSLTRQWVLTPRNLNYWVPIVDVLRRLLMERCCSRYYRPTKDRELDLLERLWSQALSFVRSPLDSAEYSVLHDALGKPAEAGASLTPHTAEPAPAPLPGTAPPPGGTAASLWSAAEAGAAPAPRYPGPYAPEWGADRIEALEKQVAELQAQVAKGAAGGT